MTQKLKIGFIALCDSASLIVAHERGFFTQEGLQVDLVREPSWANIRDKLAFGLLDAAHMLAPMLIEASLGAGNVHMPLTTGFALSSGGGRITLVKEMDRERPRLAMVYPFSSHHYALRQYTAANGLDAELVVLPPTQMIAALSSGQIQGFCAGAPWGLLAETLGLGLDVVSYSLPGRMEKVLGVRQAWHDDNVEAHSGLMRALRAASHWTNRPENRGEVAEILARTEYLNAPADVIASGLADIDFTANRPSIEEGRWYLDRMVEYGQIHALQNTGPILADLFRVATFDEIIF